MFAFQPVKKLPAAFEWTMVQHVSETSNCIVVLVPAKAELLVIPEPASRQEDCKGIKPEENSVVTELHTWSFWED